MNYQGLIISAIGIFALVCAYKDFDFFMNNRKTRLVTKLFGGRSGARTFYILLGVLLIVFGLFASLA